MHFSSASVRFTISTLVGAIVSLVAATSATASAGATLTASDASADARFGTSVAIDGDTAIVGAVGDDDDDDVAGANQGSAYVFRWVGEGWVEEAKLTASDAAANDDFGVSVAISGDTAIVGAFSDDDAAGTNQGSAYVFTRSGSTWTEQAKLTASDAALFDLFGISVALDGDTAIVGARQTGTNQGSAYVFTRLGSSWIEEAKLTSSGAGVAIQFGNSVALSGDTAIVGAWRDDAGGTDQGSAYVFKRSGGSWTEQAKLTASDAAANDQIGYSVALDGDTAIVGAISDDDAGISSGSAYVYTRSGASWTEQAKLTASDAATGDQFGWSVEISGDTAMVGAWREDGPAGADQGSAHIFERGNSTWTEPVKLTASDGAAGDQFGFSVALDGDTAIVGARLDDDSGGGSAHIFERIGPVWIGPDQEVLTPAPVRLTASDAGAGDQFGYSVALDGDTAIVGARNDDDAGIGSGSAYIFTPNSSGSWTEQIKLTASDAAAEDDFGVSVAISGDTAIVGARLNDDSAGTNQGSAYVYSRSGSIWGEQAKLTAADAAADDDFGVAVAISGDTAIVGAPRRRHGGKQPGFGVRLHAQWLNVDRAGQAHHL